MQAQDGARSAQMFMVGSTDDGSSRLPALTTLNCGRAVERAKSCVPQFGQNSCVIWFPLSAVRANSETLPVAIKASADTSRFTVPFAARCWQSRHQQMRAAIGSPISLKATWPQRQRPVLSRMGSFPESCGSWRDSVRQGGLGHAEQAAAPGLSTGDVRLDKLGQQLK